jgi:hypothetical protein
MSNALPAHFVNKGKTRNFPGQRQRRAWDSNPQVLSDNGFQDRPLAN